MEKIGDVEFMDYIRGLLAFLLIGGPLFIVIISLLKGNFEFPVKIIEIFSGWMGAIVIFFFQQKEVERKSKQLEEKSNEIKEKSSAVDSLGVDSIEKEKILDYLFENYPEISDELLIKKIINL